MANALRRIPVWVWLTAIVVASAIFRALLGRGIVAPFIMVDEVIWAEVARGIAASGEPLLRDQPDPGYSVLYPLVISPVYALVDGLPAAYAAVKTVNAVVMSLAAVPAYFLARRVLGAGLALLAAVLALAVPSFAYTGTVMSENLYYPLFLLVALALVLVLERPTGFRVGILVVCLGLAFAARVQAVAIVPAVLLAPPLLGIFERRAARDVLRRYRLLYGVLLGLGALVLAVQTASRRSPQDLLGAYSAVGDETYDTGLVLDYLLWHVAELSLYLLVIPLAATIVLVGRARRLDPPLQAFLAAALALTICLVPVVAAFASSFSGRIEERNLFYVAPLFMISLLAWMDRGAPRPRALATGAAAVSVLLVYLVPYDKFLTTSAITDTLMLLPLWSLQDSIGADWITSAAVALAVVLAAAFLFVPKRYVIVLPLVVLGVWMAALKPIWSGKHGFEQFSRGALFQGIRTAERDWIDRALPDGAIAAFLWTGRTDRLTVNENEFFNRAIGPVYYLASPTAGGLPETRVTINRKTGAVLLPDGTPVRDEYVVADSSFEPDGEAVARDRGWGITLWRTQPPLVSAFRIDGLYPNDTWSGRTVTYLRRRCAPGRLMVALSSDGNLFLDPQTVVARSGGRVLVKLSLRPGRRAVMRVPLVPDTATGDCRVDFTITPTEVPSRVTGGANPDDRELGAHFNGFVYTPRA